MGKIKKTFEQRHTFTPDNMVMSWSMYSTFIDTTYGDGKKKWYDTFVLGKKQSSPELTFGKAVADSMDTATPLIPFTRLNVKKNGTHKEYEFDTMLEHIPLVGSVDSSSKDKLTHHEFKTGVKPWDNKRVEQHGQLLFYSLCLYLQDKIKPEKLTWFLEWCPTVKTESSTFEVKIEPKQPVQIHRFKRSQVTMKDILKLAVDIKRVHKEMVEYYLLQVKKQN